METTDIVYKIMKDDIFHKNCSLEELEEEVNFLVERITFEYCIDYKVILNNTTNNKIIITGIPKNEITNYPKTLHILRLEKI